MHKHFFYFLFHPPWLTAFVFTLWLRLLLFRTSDPGSRSSHYPLLLTTVHAVSLSLDGGFGVFTSSPIRKNTEDIIIVTKKSAERPPRSSWTSLAHTLTHNCTRQLRIDLANTDIFGQFQHFWSVSTATLALYCDDQRPPPPPPSYLVGGNPMCSFPA